jgi:hypothetical protein
MSGEGRRCNALSHSGTRRCSEQATARIRMGCKHEHIGWGHACAEHALIAMANGARCHECRLADCGCLLRFISAEPPRSKP